MLQRYADRLDFLGCTVREVGEGAIFDLAPLAVRLAQEDTTIYRTIGARASRLREIHSDDDGKQSFTALQEGHTKSSDYIPLPMSASKPQSYNALLVVRGGEHPLQRRITLYRRGMSTASRRHANADTTGPPPPCAGHHGAPPHGPGHAREQRLLCPQAGLVLPRL